MKSKTQFVCSQCAAVFKHGRGNVLNAVLGMPLMKKELLPVGHLNAVGNGQINAPLSRQLKMWS